MKTEDKFFLNYVKSMYPQGTLASRTLAGRPKEIINQVMDNRDYILFVLCADFRTQVNLMLFCAAINNEL